MSDIRLLVIVDPTSPETECFAYSPAASKATGNLSPTNQIGASLDPIRPKRVLSQAGMPNLSEEQGGMVGKTKDRLSYDVEASEMVSKFSGAFRAERSYA